MCINIKYIFFLLLPPLKGVIVMASFNNVSIFYIYLNTLLALRVWCCFYIGPLCFSIFILSLHVWFNFHFGPLLLILFHLILVDICCISYLQFKAHVIRIDREFHFFDKIDVRKNPTIGETKLAQMEDCVNQRLGNGF